MEKLLGNGLNIQLFAEGGDKEKLFTQEEVDKLIAERIARAEKKFNLEKKELERKHNESLEEYEERIKTANMTAEEKYKHELEKRDKALAEKEAALKKITVDGLKKSTLSKYKLPETFLDRISGESEEEIETSVKSFQEGISNYLKSQSGGTPGDMTGGSKEKKDNDAELNAFDEAMKY